MRLNLHRPPASHRDAGFTLLEVVVAAGILLVTITAVTAAVVSAARSGARLEASMDCDRAARVVAQRLRLLPYCAGVYPQPVGGRGDLARDVVAAVFPHASPGENTGTARFLPSEGAEGEEAGSFVTLWTADGVQVKCVARFLAAPGGQQLGPEALRGWDAAVSVAPPAAALSIRISTAGGLAVSFVREALSDTPVVAQSTTGPG